jgi:hypothetical protein
MANFETDLTVVAIYERMYRYGIDLSQFWTEITNTWHETPAGFRFALPIAKYFGLMGKIIENNRFGRDCLLGESQHLGVSFREDHQPDSLHVVMAKRFLFKEEYVHQYTDWPGCIIHVDSVSVVRGVNKSTRRVQYDEGKLLQHLATDLKHTPLIAPGGRAGLVFGWRF